MNCKETRQRLTPYVDEELDEAQRHLVDEHLAACSPCARRVAFEVNFNRILREGLAEDEVPSGVLARVRRGIAREARAVRGGFGRWLLHPLTAYATAGALLLALVLPAAVGAGLGVSGWQEFFQADRSFAGILVCFECDRAHATAEEQRNCRRFNHHSAIRTAEGMYWTFVHRGAGAELNERTELRGAPLVVSGEAFGDIHTIDVHSYELS